MADPVIPGGIRVLMIWQGVTMLPEDRYINTFAFASDAADSTAAKLAAIAKVQRFYATSFAGSSITQYLGGHAIVEGASELRAYSMGDPVGQREPTVVPWDQSGGSITTSNPLPSEVAVVGSYYAQFNKPRSRGRLYIGPLNGAAISTIQANTPVQVKQEFQLSLLAAMLDLGFDDVGPRWSLLSKDEVTGVPRLKIITDCWVDNAFDTQRRRGEKATNRVAGVTQLA